MSRLLLMVAVRTMMVPRTGDESPTTLVAGLHLCVFNPKFYEEYESTLCGCFMNPWTLSRTWHVLVSYWYAYTVRSSTYSVEILCLAGNIVSRWVVFSHCHRWHRVTSVHCFAKVLLVRRFTSLRARSFLNSIYSVNDQTICDDSGHL